MSPCPIAPIEFAALRTVPLTARGSESFPSSDRVPGAGCRVPSGRGAAGRGAELTVWALAARGGKVKVADALTPRSMN
jgi:hypothetical protein